MKNDKAIEKVHGIAHLFAAASYSLCGVKRLWGETAFRHEILAAIISLVLLVLIGVPIFYTVVTVILFLVTIAVEALNTAIEELVDRVSPEWSIPAKNAKDLGSLAVMCLLLASGVWISYAVYLTIFGA